MSTWLEAAEKQKKRATVGFLYECVKTSNAACPKEESKARLKLLRLCFSLGLSVLTATEERLKPSLDHRQDPTSFPAGGAGAKASLGISVKS